MKRKRYQNVKTQKSNVNRQTCGHEVRKTKRHPIITVGKQDPLKPERRCVNM